MKDKKLVSLTVRLPQEVKEEIQMAAEENYMSSSQLIRKIVIEWLQEKEGEK